MVGPVTRSVSAAIPLLEKDRKPLSSYSSDNTGGYFLTCQRIAT